MTGGLGDDLYAVDNVGDVVVEATNEGDDDVHTSINYTLAANVERLEADGTADLVLTGNTLNNGIWGNAGNNTLSGGAGNDYQVGNAGNDVYVFNRGDGQDSIDNTDLLTATDILRFGAGISDTEILAAQSGNDMVLKVKGTGDQIWFFNYFGANTVNGGVVSDHKIDRVEFANGAVWDQVRIQTEVNKAINNHAPTVNAYLPALQAVSGTPFTYTVAANTIVDPDTWDSVSYSATLAGGSPLPAWLSFNAAARTFTGTPSAGDVGSQQFILWGTDNYGAGIGEYVTVNVAAPNHAPVLAAALPDQAAAQGSVFNYTVPAATFTDQDSGDTLSYSAALVDGSALPSWLSFNGATRTFSGTPNAQGVLGVRVTATDSGNLTATDDFNITVSTQNLTLNGTSGVDTLTGGVGDDTLNGLAGNDTLNGNAGNDRLDGGAGTDTMRGGVGDDTYVVDVATDVVTENANEGTDTVETGLSYTLGINIENLLLLGTSAVNGTGNALSNYLIGNSAINTLTGGAGNDRLDGKAGADKLLGGVGDDVYVVDVTTDVITENANEGTDTVETGITYTLGTNLENLTLTGTAAVNGTGNALNNLLIGNSAVNTLNGGTGDDRLDGGLGLDTLTGGAGIDHFLFSTAFGSSNVDTITDFVSGTDKIDLSKTIFTAFGGLAVGSSLGNAEIGNHLRYTASTGVLAYDADGSAGAGAAVQIALIGTVSHPAILQGLDFNIAA